MKKLLGSLIVTAIALAGSTVPVHAAPRAEGLSTTLTVEGSWSSGVGLNPSPTSHTLHGTATGAFRAGSDVLVGAVSCYGRGSGVESLASGNGELSVSCYGIGIPVYLSPTSDPLRYERRGTALVATGLLHLSTPTGGLYLGVTLAYEVNFQQVPGAYTYSGAGSLLGLSSST